MAQIAQAYMDSKGRLCKTPDEATISDLTAILGGAEANTATARIILEKREQIEQLFREHDTMLGKLPTIGTR